jgi:ATP-dependent Clp protease ATP-binding subunit ClpC
MFERYTERARRVLFFGRYEASQMGSRVIDTEHLLLGLLREGKGLTSRLFAAAGIRYDEMRREIEGRVGEAEAIPTSVEIPFSPLAKRVLHATAEEADRLLHTHVGTEHLLLGLLRVGEGLAASILLERGMRLDAIRDGIVQLLSPHGRLDDS